MDISFNMFITELSEREVGQLRAIGCDFLYKLPDDFVVNGDMDVRECIRLRSLPENLLVGGDLYLSGSKIRQIPASATIKGNIYW